ncbi:unnamed protein product, partial [Durusdinium trenchii]
GKRLCYCLTSLIQIEQDEPEGFQLVQVSDDSSSMDAAVFSKVIQMNGPSLDIYRFGGCVSSVIGPATDRVYWGAVNPDPFNPTVRWRELDPSPVPFAGHTVTMTAGTIDRQRFLVLGGVNSCDDSATYMSFLWIWSIGKDGNDGTWDKLPPIPDPCGLAFHSANSFSGRMMVFGGRRGTSGSGCDSNKRVSSTLWLFDIYENTWTERATTGDAYGVWGHASEYYWDSRQWEGLFLHGGRLQDGSIDKKLRWISASAGSRDPVDFQTISDTGPQRMFHTLLTFRDDGGDPPDFVERLKVMGGVRSTGPDWRIPEFAYDETWTIGPEGHRSSEWNWDQSNFSYPDANGVWGQAAAQQQLNRTVLFETFESRIFDKL